MIKFLKKHLSHKNFLRLSWHRSKSFLAAIRYGFPARNLQIIGITGTDGKTTTVAMIHHILQDNAIPHIAASTAFLVSPSGITANKSHKTSMSPWALQSLLRKGVSEGATHAVIEMSSHGLVQGRVSNTWPVVAGITNLTPESLDYHHTMEQYRADKGLLFRSLRASGTKVLNQADKHYDYYAGIRSYTTTTYGVVGASLYATYVTGDADLTSCLLHHNNDSPLSLTMPIPGEYNVFNAQCALLCAEAIGIPITVGVRSFLTFTGVPGRLQKVEAGQDFTVFVDFTVTSNAYEQTLTTLQAMKPNGAKVLVLAGCCGNRMQQKRKTIGELCSQYSDILVITEDETYGEDPVKVLEEVWSGVNQSSCEAYKVPSRKEAIKFIINKATKDDIVILCGMGPFDTFKTLQGDIPWNEAALAREAIESKLAHEQK